MSVTPDDTRRNDLLSSWKQLFFELFVFFDFSGPKEVFFIICTKFVKKPFGYWWVVAWHISCARIREKVGQEILVTGKVAFFFKTFHFQHPIRIWKSPYKFQSKCQNSLWTLIKWSLMFVTLDDTRKNEFFSSWKQLFLNCLFLSTSWVPKKWSYHLHNICQNTLWTLINCCLTYVMCNITRKSGPKFFYHWKECFFSKLSIFNSLLDPKRALICSKVDVKIACGLF